MREVVIVGAGPVGLWTALQLKKRAPDTAVVVYERHAVYQRHHVLRLDHWSLLLYGRQQPKDPAERAFYQAITAKTLGQVASQPAGSVFIRTHDLEGALKAYATALGIVLIQERIEDPQVLMARHPACAHFIAADGAHSPMRQALLGPDAVDTYPLQRVVELKYQVEGPATRLNTLAIQGALAHMAFEYVGKPKEGRTAITVRFFLDEATYAALPPATFKAPLTPTDPRLPPALAQDLVTYLSLRQGTGGAAVCAESAKLSALTLSLYASKAFALRQGQQAWFIVGDAAMGVPYFRALNSGLILGSRLAQILAARHWPFHAHLARQVMLYQAHRPLHIASEFSIARGKDMVLRGFEAVRQQPWVPWLGGRKAPSAPDASWAWAVDCRTDA